MPEVLHDEDDEYLEVEEEDPILIDDEDDVLRKFREKAIDGREVHDVVVVPSTNDKIRMRILSHNEMAEVQKVSGSTTSREISVHYASSFEIIAKSITHMNGKSIEEMTKVTSLIPGANTVQDKLSLRKSALVKIRPYWEAGFSEQDVITLVNHYYKMVERRQEAMTVASKAPKKKSKKPSLKKAST